MLKQIINRRIITFTMLEYLNLMCAVQKGETFDTNIGLIAEGAVCCALDIIEGDTSGNKDAYYDDGFRVKGDIFLLAQEDGTTSFRVVDTFYTHCHQPYENMLAEIISCFNARVEVHQDLRDGIKNTELTWTTTTIGLHNYMANSHGCLTMAAPNMALEGAREKDFFIDWGWGTDGIIK